MTRMVLALMAWVPLTMGLAAGWAGSLSADVLLIEEVRQSERMEVPKNGLTQAEVRARFGDPAATHAPVGDPPITRWDYDGWSVYFEYDRVLFSVLQKGAVLDKSSGSD
jgi:hypothetical protein